MQLQNNSRKNSKRHYAEAFGFDWDPISQRMVFKIYETDGLFPLLIKLPFENAKTYELILTQHGRLNLR